MTDPVELSGDAAATAAATGSLSVGRRDYYSTHLLFAAHYAAWEAEQREELLSSDRPRFDPRHRAFVLSAVTSSVAFLEAAINEVLQDAADGHLTEKIANVPAQVRSSWSAFWLGLDAGRRGEVLEKYQSALHLANSQQFPEGAEPYQSARLLIRTRNLLLHFKPETKWSDEDPGNLVQGLGTKVPRNPQVADHGAPTSIEDLLSAGFARWAVGSVHSFTEAFAERTATILNYQVNLPRFLDDDPDLPSL